MGIGIDIYEESFVKNATSSYNLSALVGADRFSFFAYDQAQQKVHLLKSYTGFSSQSETATTLLHDVYTRDALLKSAYGNQLIAINNDQNTLVPNRFYDQSQQSTYLQKLIEVTEEYTIQVDDIPDLDIKNVYLIDNGLKSLLESYFPGATLMHASTLFIKGTKVLSGHRSGAQCYLNVMANQFQIVVYDGQELVFSNSYDYQTSNDFIYYAMLVFDQFKLKPEVVPLYLCGQIVENSEIYRLLYRYIRHIHFIQLPNFLNFGPRLKKQTVHQYFNLYCTKLCV